MCILGNAPFNWCMYFIWDEPREHFLWACCSWAWSNLWRSQWRAQKLQTSLQSRCQGRGIWHHPRRICMIHRTTEKGNVNIQFVIFPMAEWSWRYYLIGRALSYCFDIKWCKVNLYFQQVACQAGVPSGPRGKAIWVHSSLLERHLCTLLWFQISLHCYNLVLLRWPIWLCDWQLVDQFLTLKVTRAIPFARIHLLDDCIHTVDITSITSQVTWLCTISAHLYEYFSSYSSGKRL